MPRSEEDPGFDYEDDLRRADEAVATIVDRGLYTPEARRRFQLRTHAASVRELRDHWAVAGAYDPEERPEELIRRRDAIRPRR